ncbi:MAG: sulfatase [bacterium]
MRVPLLPMGPLALLACALTSAVAAADDPLPEGRPPNIVLLLADDLGYGDLACYGSPVHRTPHLDALAAGGMVFTNAYANAPNCAPTRAALMSGLYAPRTGIYTVSGSARGKAKNRKLIPTPNRTDLDESFVTLAETLSGAGYATAHMGKWHLGADPCSQGFDVNVGGNKAGSPRSYHSPYSNPKLEDGPEGEYLTDRMGREASGFIEEHADEPFFLQLAFFSVHTPIQGRADLVESYVETLSDSKDAKYAAMVTALDEAVGQVLATLAEQDLLENTLVLFFSDNGGRSPFGDNGGLRGSKGMLYEGGIREPLIAHWPGKISAGSRCLDAVIGLDLYPTLMELAGVPRGSDQMLDGVSIMPCLRGEALDEREGLFWHFPAYLQGYLPSHGPFRTTPVGAIRRGPWKLMEFFEDGRLELYNLVADSAESVNLAAEQPEVVADLHGRMRAWRERVKAPVPTELNPEYEDE